VGSFPIKGQDKASSSTPALPILPKSNFKKVPYSHTLNVACLGYEPQVRLQFWEAYTSEYRVVVEYWLNKTQEGQKIWRKSITSKGRM